MYPVETDPRLQSLSDTEILLNFARALSSLYPHMKAVGAHCYDPFDEVVEPLFHGLVYGSFSGKYGVPVPTKRCHRYDSVGGDYERISHVRVRPRSLPLEATIDEAPIEITQALLSEKHLVFKTFGDGIHDLTGGECEGDPYDLTFELTQVEVFDPHDRTAASIGVFLWVPNDAVEYEFVFAPPRDDDAG
jgi:hypothetical protein